jgi:hypothetical protein
MWVRVVIGVVLLVVGGVWIGQGVGWIEGSFMTGEAVWAVIGAVAFVVGVWLIASATRGRRRRV